MLRRYYGATQEIAAAARNNSGKKRKGSLRLRERVSPTLGFVLALNIPKVVKFFLMLHKIS